MRFYSWQKTCLRAWKNDHFHGIVHVVTGAGKTVMALGAVRLLQKLCPFPICVRVVVPTTSLARQWTASMRRFLPDCRSGKQIPGQYGGGRKDRPDRPYMVYVVNSAREALSGHVMEDWKNGRGVLLIADECHHYASEENRKIFRFLESPNVPKDRYFSLGLSATPQVMGYDSILAPALGKEIYRYGFQEAANEQMVCPFAVYQISLSFLADELAQYNDLSGKLSALQKKLFHAFSFAKEMDQGHFFAFLKSQAAEDPESLAAVFLNLTMARSRITYLAAARSSCVLELIRHLGLSRQILIFGERIEQAEEVYRSLSRLYPSKAGCYHSAMSPQARSHVLERFHNGELRILVTCRALDEGIDVPAASVGIILSGAAVSRQRIQRLGRILRISGKKDIACMYYLYVRESSEESAFLSQLRVEIPVCGLSYEMGSHSFIYPRYEEAAAAVLEKARERGLDAAQQREMRRCLMEGLIRPDWLLPEETVEERIRRAKGRRERNYWVCVREMGREGRQ